MQKLFDASVVKTLKDAIKRGKFTLEDLDTPPPGWTEVVNNCKGNPAFPQGYQGVEYKNLARVEEPKPVEEKVELTDPKDLPTYF
ncbi:hypothetical protein [uncultured Mediterranean phage uvMED]|nr:hypothetical protein [uncultured Mediterranean phage uvMED]BAR21032.1 hypothetical protein [uncultured Mediterranean phage uvMED]